MRLTKTSIQAAKHPGGNKMRILWDDIVTGLGLRVYPGGKKSFVIRYRNEDNRLRFLTLGEFGPLTVHGAREMATEKKGEVIKGGDPAEERQARRKAPTVNQLCDDFLDLYAKPHRKSWREDERRIDSHIKPQIGSLKVRAVTVDDLIRLHQRIGERGEVEANRTINLVRRMWNWAMDGKRVPRLTENPATKVKRFDEFSRERFLTDEEWEKLCKAIEDESKPTYGIRGSKSNRIFEWLRDNGPGTIDEVAEAVEHPRTKTAVLLANLAQRGKLNRVETGKYEIVPLDAEPDPFIPAIILLYVLLGMRKSELLRLRWDRLDLKRGTLLLGRTKSGRPLYLPLPKPAVEILEDLPRLAGNPYCFPGRNEGMHLVNIDKSWRRIRERAELLDVTIHDLRRTVGSWLVQDGQSLAIVQRVLNHKTYEAVLRYAKLDDETVRKAMDAHATRVMKPRQGST